ncbi:MAG: hypothetical protein IAE65_08670 [Ignavibacteria bacterium]|nr:hypothetical protein [Ignavibacteria bacterium]
MILNSDNLQLADYINIFKLKDVITSRKKTKKYLDLMKHLSYFYDIQ